MKKIIALSGPPHCGKDTIGRRLTEKLVSETYAMVGPVRLAAFELLGEWFTESRYAELKETPIDMFGGMNLRQWMISFSEDFMKPKCGTDVFGRMAVNQLAKKETPLVILTDSGFFEEQMAVVNAVGRDNYLYVRIRRDGCDWSKDSRSYINFVDPQIHQLGVDNNGTIDEACDFIIAHCRAVLQWEIY